jgi:hypothetical protein
LFGVLAGAVFAKPAAEVLVEEIEVPAMPIVTAPFYQVNEFADMGADMGIGSAPRGLFGLKYYHEVVSGQQWLGLSRNNWPEA